MTQPSTYSRARDQMTRRLVLGSLERNDWNIMRSARALGINRAYIYRLLHRYGISRPTQRRPNEEAREDGFP